MLDSPKHLSTDFVEVDFADVDVFEDPRFLLIHDELEQDAAVVDAELAGLQLVVLA